MNNGIPIPKIKYCDGCKRFYVNFCWCNNHKIVEPPNLMSKFLYVIFLIYNYGNKIFNYKNNYNQALEKKKLVQNPFSKYFNLFGNKIRPKHNFYIYMMINSEENNGQEGSNRQYSTETTPRHEVSETTSPSSCSLVSKKSTSGGVLSRLSKSLKRKKKPSNNGEQCVSPKSIADGDSNFSYQSRSKIPVLKSKQKDCKPLSRTKSTIQPTSFFRKLANKPSKPEIEENEQKVTSSEETLKQINEEPPQTTEEMHNNEKTNSKLSEQNMDELYCRRSSSHVCNQFKSNFPASNINLDVNLKEGLREVINISQKLQESEAHLAHVISKYIQDHNFEKELLNALTNHAKLHIDAERRTQNLAQEMWLQQSDLMKAQETVLQENLSSVIKQNRKLQEEMENLVRQNEKLCINKDRQFPNYLRQPLDSSNHLIENLSVNNDKLRYKASAMTAQLEEQEKEFHVLHRKTQLLEQQLRNSNSQVQNYKVMLQRVQTGNELEQAHLSHELQKTQMTIKETAEAGDILLEDLDAVKRQIKSMPCSLNFTKFKNRGNNLPDLVYMCRSCINELAKELLKIHTEIVLKEKDNNSLNEEIKRLEQTLGNSKSEHQHLQNLLKNSKGDEMELQKSIIKCSNLEKELLEYKQHMEKITGQFERDKVSFISSIDGMESLNKKIIEKEEELILTNDKMCEYKSENDALRMQIHGLKQVLTASGAGEVARELADVQEKMTFFQSQYYQLVSEKNYLIEQLQAANLERGSLNQFQNNYYQYIQVQQQDLEVLNRDNLLLREQLELERNESFVLKNEKNKLKEEKNVMRHIYQQLKSEIGKVQKLQGEVTGINIEANRLAIIAEYNKQLGEKLQSEVAERDEKISELQTNVQQLNSAQVENSKDKVALCVELTEVCTLNNQLNSSLVAEHHKSTHLDETKKKLENSTNTQLKVVEQMQRAERAALKELLKDFKNVVTQRDNLMTSQNEYLQQISDLRENALYRARSMEEINIKSLQAKEQIEAYKNKLKESQEELERIHGVVGEKQITNTCLEEELAQLKNQNGVLESSKIYLQNTVQKLHHDLNEARKNELEAKQILKGDLNKLEQLEDALNDTKVSLAEICQKNQEMVQEATMFNESYEKLLMDYEENMGKSTKTQEELRKRLADTHGLVEKGSQEVQRLEKVIEEKDQEVFKLQEHSRNLFEQVKKMEASLDDINTQSKLLSESNMALMQLREALSTLELEHQECSEAITALTEEKLRLENELRMYVEDMEAKYANSTMYIEELVKQHNNQKQKLQAEIQKLSEDLQDKKKIHEDSTKSHETLKQSHRDLASKLLTAVRVLLDEKMNRQNAEAQVLKLTNQTQELLVEKETAEKTASSISTQFEELNSRFDGLIAEKTSLQNVLCDLQESYSRSQSNLSQLKLQERDLKRKNKAASSVPSSKIISLKETRSKLQSTEERTKKLKTDLEKSHKTIMELNIKVSNLKQQLTVMEFQKCETALRLHETEGKLKTEQRMNEGFTENNQTIVKEVIQLKRDGIITQSALDTLLWLIQGQRSANLNLNH